MLNNENSIEVRNVSKSFKVYFDKGNELKEKMLFWKRNRYENRVVLNNISFTVKKELFSERRFTRVRVRDNRKCAASFNLVS